MPRSQRGVAPPHWASSEQATHFPVAGLHIGAVAGHSELFVQSVVQVRVTELQMGAVFGQSAAVRQPTQVFVAASHFLPFATQRLGSPPVHSTQIPPLQTGAELEQLAFVAQPSVQVWVWRLHLPFTPVHWASLLHWTQTSSVGWQTGCPEVHAVRFVERHSTH